MSVDCLPTFTLVEHQRGDRSWEADNFGCLSVQAKVELSKYIKIYRYKHYKKHYS